MANAFGEISRTEILEEVVEYIPELAPFLLQLWGERGMPVVVANGASTWATFYLVDGLFQGHYLSSTFILPWVETSDEKIPGGLRFTVEA